MLGMHNATQYAADEAAKLINRSQPVATIGGRLRGLDPSKPGEPPKKVTSHLFQNIRKTVHATRYSVIGRYGSSVIYAAYLELGTRKMAPRPFLRPIIGNTLHRQKIRRMLGAHIEKK
jgi:HK97 gp10 family phage protein